MAYGPLVRYISDLYRGIFLTTSFSMEPEAEQNCESLLGLAIQADPSNVEVLQSLASVRMSQQRQDDARKYVEQAWRLWKDLRPGNTIQWHKV